jgi:Mg-chelatase subunit ChlD
VEESRQGWRRGGKGRSPVAAGGKGWQSRKQSAAKSGTSRHRTRLVALGLVTVSLLVGFIILVLIIPRDMPLVIVGVATYDSPIPPNAYVAEDAKRLASTNTGNIKLMPAGPDQIGHDTLIRHLQTNLHPGRGFVSQKLVTVYLSAHGVVNSGGQACLLLSDSKPLDERTWMPVSELFALLNAERPDAVKVLLLDSGKIDANWSLGILHNAFPDRVAEELGEDSRIFVITDRASGQLAWSAPERDGTIFGHFVASGLSAAADADGRNGVSLLEFYDFVRSKVDGWVSDNRSSRQTPQLIPMPTKEQDFKLVTSGAGPSENRSAKELVVNLSSAWQKDALPLWERFEKFAQEFDLVRYDPLGLAKIEAELLGAEQLLLAGNAYKTKYSETLKRVSSLMSEAAAPSLPDELRGFSLPFAAQLDHEFDPATSGQEVLDAWREAGGWPKDEEGKEKPFSLSYLTAANVAARWLAESPVEPGGSQLREAIRLVEAGRPYLDDEGVPIEHVQEVQLLKLVSQHADVTNAENWPSALRAALRQAMLAQKMAGQIAAPDDERVHYWVQPKLNATDQRRRAALDRIFIGDDASLVDARRELVQCQEQEGVEANHRLQEVTAAYQLRDRVWSRLPHIAFWFSQQGRLDAVQPDLNLVLQHVAKLSELLDADDTTQPLDISDKHRSVVDELRAASDKLESEYRQHVVNQLVATPASGTLLRTHQILRAPLTTAKERETLFLGKYLASMELDHETQQASLPAPPKDPLQLTGWPTHPAVLIAGHDESRATRESNAVRDEAVTWFDAQGGSVRDALRDISNQKSRLEQETDDLLRSEMADATARRTRSGLAKADAMVRSAAALLDQRPWKSTADPTRRLRYVDRHFQLLWHSHRVLEDFWGPTTSQRQLPYFVNVADSYLSSAKALAPGSSVLGYAAEADLKRLRDRRLAATAIDIAVGSTLKCYEPKETREYDFEIGWKPDLPQGQAAVFITERVDNDPARLFPVLAGSTQVRRRGQDVKNANSRVEQRLPLVKPADRTELPLAARVLFRGHEQSQRFTAEWPQHVMAVRAKYTHPEMAKVTVEGDAERNAYIMFIVDCSASMSKSASVSANNRMVSAKASLNSVIEELGSQPNYKIGLRAYGRIAGFKVDAKGIPVRDADGDYIIRHLDAQRGIYVEVSKNVGNRWLHPDEDADDLLVEFGQADQVQKVRERIPNLLPTGVTPLYRALLTSLSKDFKFARRDDSKHIVLITDGVNEVSGLSALGKKIEQSSPRAVLDAQQGTDVHIHIIFMDPPQNVPAELTEIPQKTGGIYKGANEAAALVQGIREAIGLVEFSVARSGSSTSNSRKYRLGDTATVNEFRGDHEVRIHGALGTQPPMRQIYLDGGEAIKLIYEHPLNRIPRLVFPIEDPLAAYSNAPVVAGLTRDGERHDFIIRAHRPEVKGADVDFFVTVQDVNGTSERDSRTEYFTPPVRQVWCEITPVVGNTAFADQRYYFFDVDNVLDQPIPKLRFHAKDWPREAKKAKVEVWFGFHPFRRTPTGFQGITVEESGGSKQFSVPGLEGVAFEASGQKLSAAEPYRLTIRETRSPLGIAAIIVSPAADEITHNYYSFLSSNAERGTGGNVAKHSFEFEKPLTVNIDVLPSSQFKKDPSVIAVPRLDVLVEE